MAEELTELQKKFIEALFGEAEGDPNKAKKIAGYAPSTKTRDIMMALGPEIISKTRQFIEANAIKAAFSLEEVLDSDQPIIGVREKIKVAQDLLDRAGLGKTDKVEVSGGEGIFILPAKMGD